MATFYAKQANARRDRLRGRGRDRNRHYHKLRDRLTVEFLEPRLVLDATILITEVVADNEFGLEDEDGDRSDWIEVHNAGDAPANLGGWHLTDDVEDRTQWTFPQVTVNPGEYLVVFASGKDRTNVDGPLHTNFRLSASGEYVGLYQADGATVVSAFAPQFPALQPDTAYGLPQGAAEMTLIEPTSTVRALVPTAENGGPELGSSWTQVEFDDSGWKQGPGGVGFEGRTGFEEFFGTDVGAEMRDLHASAYIRIPFNVDQPGAIFSMVLGMQYDDGYVAYLNGQEVVRRNAPDALDWNAEAIQTHRDSLATMFEPVNLSEYVGSLRQGVNVLAIHGLNTNPQSDDFLIAAELKAELPQGVASTEAGFIARPTPHRPNGLTIYSGLIDDVKPSAHRGFYDAPFDVTIATETPGTTLVYTMDGSAPTLQNGVQVASPDPTTSPATTLNIAKTTTLRAAAFKDGFLSSPIDTQTYIMLQDVIAQDVQTTLDAGFPDMWGRFEPDYGMDPDVVGPNDIFDGEFAGQIIDSLKSAPTVSLVLGMDDLFGPEGIYSNSLRTGFDWERSASFELIYPDGTTHFQADAGLRIQGDNVRNMSNSKKQSFRLEFRERWGPTKLRFLLFGEDATDSFDTIILRGLYNDGWVHTPNSTQYIRDQWARSTLLEMGQPQAHGEWMHVYVNGFYWGLYNVVERPNASFSASYFGGDKDEWDALNTGNVRDGTSAAWDELRRLGRDVGEEDQTLSNAAYLRLIGKNPDGTDNPQIGALLDVENYIDYLIVNFYGGNVDWPHRNYYVGRLQGPESTGFKFYAWDTEKILDHGEGANLSTNRTHVGDGVATAYRSLRANDEFRLQFADHVHRHFFNGGALYVDPQSPVWDPLAPEKNVPAARYDRLANDIEMPLIGESARWGDTQSNSTRNDGRVYTLRDWRPRRDNLFERFFPRRSEIVLEQFVDAGLYPALAAPVFNQHGGVIEPGFMLSIDAPGDVYFTLDGSDPRQSALEPGVDVSGVSPTAGKYSGPVTLKGGTVVKARTLVDGVWSALNEATFSTGVPPLRITEIMYHPAASDAGGDDDDFEFIELANISTASSINLGGVSFTEGVEFVFPELTLAPGERLVVVRNQVAFQQRYGDGIKIAGQYGGTVDDFKLSNGGETLRLVDSLGGVIQEFTYDDAWIPATDGAGHALTIVDPGVAAEMWNSAQAWRASRVAGGSPGSDDTTDLNGDGRADAQDIDRLCSALRAGETAFDLSGDGIVDLHDLSLFIEQELETTFGDANLDGRFDSADLVSVFQVGEYEDQVADNSTWAEGDWNCDADVDSADLVTAFRSGGFSAALAPVRFRDLALNQWAAAVDPPPTTLVDSEPPSSRPDAREYAIEPSERDSMHRADYDLAHATRQELFAGRHQMRSGEKAIADALASDLTADIESLTAASRDFLTRPAVTL